MHEEDLMKCVSALSRCTSRDEQTLESILGDIHRSVFGANEGGGESLKPSDLLSLCNNAVEWIGGNLGKRKRSAAMRLSIGVVVVELLARLTRVLLWGMGDPEEMSLCCDRLREIKEDAEQLEVFLLPRFFLKLPISPITLRDVLLKTPWGLFSQKYGVQTTSHGTVPAQVATVLSDLRTNFGCDFLHNCRVDVELPLPAYPASALTDTGVSRSTKSNATSDIAALTCESSAAPGAVVSSTVDTVNVGASVDGSSVCVARSAPKSLRSGRSTLRGAAKHEMFGAKAATIPANIKNPLPMHPTRSLPAYMLRKWKPGAAPRATVGCGGREIAGTEENNLPVTPDTQSSAGDDSDTEVLATESPVRKRVCSDGTVVPPSPSRLTRDEMEPCAPGIKK
ncbi:uncharacterized protein TEOVI_000664100 [Trypanosoma equiperdum]|uniref:Uncharacterized protein n=2 Tax=Trypanozoon TaxID=39700 RepID=Q581Z2_TRYB2|nr:hypothetical protein, conserved [Trypanosoma brucei brucei TREU927]AAX79411.1 hypothetical protein, conserved [Trypanosoma brucei]AAZ12957.1 hypothetical protein, conserved [Trypanosoma brucei brucei TREU927]SCU68458.1 hypothetical protein, conserved [Trypanosoma equiperdum]